MAKPVQIRNEAVVREIRELAEREQRPITEVVGNAVRYRLEALRRRDTIKDRRRRIDQIVREFNALPHTGRTLTDGDLYDEDGFPK